MGRPYRIPKKTIQNLQIKKTVVGTECEKIMKYYSPKTLYFYEKFFFCNSIFKISELWQKVRSVVEKWTKRMR